MTPSLTERLKRDALEQEIVILQEQYKAISEQIQLELDSARKVILERKRGSLESQIRDLEEQVNNLGHQLNLKNPSPNGPDDFIVIQLQLIHRSDHIEVRSILVPRGGQPKETTLTPFERDEIPAIQKALDIGGFDEKRFKPEYKTILEKHGGLIQGQLRPDFIKMIGIKLFKTLFSGTLLTELEFAKQSHQPIICQIIFDPEDVDLIQYPWELIHDGSVHLQLVNDLFEMSRLIAFDKPPSRFSGSFPLRMLFINPRPKNESLPLDSAEKEAILGVLKPLRDSGKLIWEELNPCTWENFRGTIAMKPFHLIHFDGHGSFERICPSCGLAHFPSMQKCERCGVSMIAETPKGYLHFEEDGGSERIDRVGVDDIKTVLNNTHIRLVVLSACKTALSSRDDLFSGLGPALIQAGIPGVVAMQGSPSLSSMSDFVACFYDELIKGKRLSTAVNVGRMKIMRDKPSAWFMPVVYLRSSDKTYGQLFSGG